MQKKQQPYKLEIGLGLSLIVLVLLVLNIASHYTLYRFRHSIENQITDRLTEAAVVTANHIIRDNRIELTEDVLQDISGNYDLTALSVFHLTYDRVLDIQQNNPTDSALVSKIPSLVNLDLNPLLGNRTIINHETGSDETLLLFPMEYAGSKYIICLTGKDQFLGSLENAGIILIVFGIVGILVIAFLSYRFIRRAIYPIKRLREKAEQTGRFDSDAGDEINELIGSYEKIIEDLRSKETELVKLNQLITLRADNLEVYNNYILSSISTGIITLDNENRVSSVNRAAREILEFEDKDYNGIGIHDLLINFTELVSMVEEYNSDKSKTINRTMEINCSDSSPADIAAAISGLNDSNDRKIGISILLNDMTEFEKLRRELEMKQQMAALGEMSAGLAHQLRNSIAAITGFASLIRKKADPDSITWKNTQMLLTESAEAENLISRFLDYARPLNPIYENADIIEMLRGIIDSTQRRYPDIMLNLMSEADTPIILSIDELLIKQAVANLIDNACKAVNDVDGEVIITVSRNNNRLNIDIADNGYGIPDEFRDKIYTPFFSGSPSGSGLGLPLARKIIIQHEGQINFTSDNENGTVFTVSLPVNCIEYINKGARRGCSKSGINRLPDSRLFSIFVPK